jgi:hypothetical protein
MGPSPGCLAGGHPPFSQPGNQRSIGTGKKKLVAAARYDLPHEALTTYGLCREFGWTPRQLARQDAKTIEMLLLIMNDQRNLAQRTETLDSDSTMILIDNDEDS